MGAKLQGSACEFGSTATHAWTRRSRRAVANSPLSGGTFHKSKSYARPPGASLSRASLPRASPVPMAESGPLRRCRPHAPTHNDAEFGVMMQAHAHAQQSTTVSGHRGLNLGLPTELRAPRRARGGAPVGQDARTLQGVCWRPCTTCTGSSWWPKRSGPSCHTSASPAACGPAPRALPGASTQVSDGPSNPPVPASWSHPASR